MPSLAVPKIESDKPYDKSASTFPMPFRLEQTVESESKKFEKTNRSLLLFQAEYGTTYTTCGLKRAVATTVEQRIIHDWVLASSHLTTLPPPCADPPQRRDYGS